MLSSLQHPQEFPLSGSGPLGPVLSPWSQVPVGWPLGRLVRASVALPAGSFRRTLCGRVFRPD